MKKGLLLALFAVFGWVGIASATPVSFTTSLDDSSVTLGGTTSSSWFLGSGDIDASLNSGLGSQAFTLNDGESYTFDFIDFYVTAVGLAGGKYTIDATLDFSSPNEADTSASGSGLWGTFGGVISGGTLEWLDMPTNVTLIDGNVLEIDFEDVIALGIGSTTTISATVTNLGGGVAPVPEPSTFILLGAGLAGLGFYRRKRMK